MSLSELELNLLRGGHVQWAAQITYRDAWTVQVQDYTPYLVSVEGVTKQVLFSGVPQPAEVTITIAAIPSAADIPLKEGTIKVGLSITDTWDANGCVWTGTINEISIINHIIELKCTGLLAKANTEKGLPFSLQSFRTRDLYKAAVTSAYTLSSAQVDEVPEFLASSHRAATRVALPTSTLGGLSGGIHGPSITVTAYDDEGTDPGDVVRVQKWQNNFYYAGSIFNLTDWSTLGGTLQEGTTKSKYPLQWHRRDLTCTFNIQHRADNVGANKCRWPLGYTQYFDAWFTVNYAGAAHSMNSKVVAWHDNGDVKKRSGWVLMEGETETAPVARLYQTKGSLNVAGALYGVFTGDWASASGMMAAAQKNNLSKNKRVVEMPFTISACNEASWTKNTRTAIGVQDGNCIPAKYQLDGPVKDSFTGDIDLVNNESTKKIDGKTQLVFEQTTPTTDAWGNEVYEYNTGIQFHGAVEYVQPNLAAQIDQYIKNSTVYPAAYRSQGLNYLYNYEDEYVAAQTFEPNTINVGEVSAFASLSELSMLGSIAVYESAKGCSFADIAPEAGTLYPVPLTSAVLQSFTYSEDQPLPTQCTVNFRDVTGTDFSYTVNTQARETDKAEAPAFNLVQGSLYALGAADGNTLSLNANSWRGSPGLLVDRLTGVSVQNSYSSSSATITRDTVTTSDGLTLMDANSNTYDYSINTVSLQRDYRVQHMGDYRFLFADGSLTLPGTKPSIATTPLLDIYPVKQWIKANERVFGDNLRRKLYTCETTLAFALCNPGDVIMAALPAYDNEAPWLMMIVGVAIHNSSCTLTLCPMESVASIDEQQKGGQWSGFTDLKNLISSFNNRG